MRLWHEQNIDVKFANLKPGRRIGIKIPVRKCKTGELIVFRDPTLWRSCRKLHLVANSSFNELSSLISLSTQRSLQSLEDLLEKYAQVGPVFIDFMSSSSKSDGNKEKEIVDLLIKYYPNQQIGLRENIVCTDSVVSLCKMYYLFGDIKPLLYYKTKTHILGLKDVMMRFLDVNGVYLQDRAITRKTVKQWHGHLVAASCANSLAAIEKLAETGVSDIIVREALWS